MASAEYEAQRAATPTVSVWAAHLYFPAFGELAAKNYYWSTADNVELEDGNLYEQQLKDVPKGRHQAGRGNDYAELVVTDPIHELYDELHDYENVMEFAEVTIRQAYEIETDYYHSEIKFRGYLKDFSITDEDHSIKLTAHAVSSRSNLPVGNRPLTRERCGTFFNVNGLLSPTDSPCGWQTSQGGNPAYCSKYYAGVDGCESHNNTHRFYAIRGLSTATVTIIPDGSTGWDYGSGTACFGEDVCVVLADRTWVPFRELDEKRHEILGCDIFDSDRIKTAQIVTIEEHEGTELGVAKFQDGVLEVTKDHEFYIGDRQYHRAGYLEDRQVKGISGSLKITSRLLQFRPLISFDPMEGKHKSYNLHSTTNNYFVTDKNGRFFFAVHNNKPPRDIGDLPIGLGPLFV